MRHAGENSKLGAQLRSLGAPWRLLLTGTPLQNNLRELFALLAFMADCTIDAVERKIKVSFGVTEGWQESELARMSISQGQHSASVEISRPA